MNKLYRYISRQISWLFLAAVIGLVLFTSLTLAVQLSDLILSKSKSFITVFKLLALKVPDFLGFALPMALVVSTFIVLARLSHDQEILAFQLGGYSLKRIAYPLIIIGLFVSAGTFALDNYLVPWTNLEYRKEIYRITTGQGLPNLQSDLFFKDPAGRIIYVGKYAEDKNEIKDIIIFNQGGLNLPGTDEEGDFPELISSSSGSLKEDSWRLNDGYLVGLDETGRTRYSVGFDQLDIKMNQAAEELIFDSRKTSEMGARKLWRRSQAAKSSGRVAEELEFAFHARLSQPIAALVFVLFSAPLSLLLRHRSKAVGILLGLISVAGYQGVLLWAKSTVRRAGLEPVLGAWLPDIIFGVLGLILFIALDRTTFKRIGSRLGAKTSPEG